MAGANNAAGPCLLLPSFRYATGDIRDNDLSRAVNGVIGRLNCLDVTVRTVVCQWPLWGSIARTIDLHNTLAYDIAPTTLHMNLQELLATP